MGFSLYQEVIQYSLAKGAAYHVHAALAIRARDENCEVRMSIAQLGKETRLPARTVRYGLLTLRSLKHISSERKGSPKGINRFFLHSLQPASIASPEVNNRQALPLADQTTGNTILHHTRENRQEISQASTDSFHSSVAATDDTRARHAASEKRRTIPPTPLPRRGKLGAWFNVLCEIYPNQMRVDRKSAERAARKFDADGPRILAAARELAKSEQWTADGGKYVPGLMKFIDSEKWRDVPVILTIEDAQLELEAALKDINGEGNWKYSSAQRLRKQFVETSTLDACLELVRQARKLQEQKLVL